MDFASILRLIRWPNVLITVCTQLFIVFGLLSHIPDAQSLKPYQLVLLIMATALLTAGGNVINDVYDIEIDKVNKPDKVIVGVKVTESQAMGLYLVMTVAAVICGFVLSNSIGRPLFSAIFIVVAFSLYLYASSLKSMLLVGNILVSILVAFVILVVAIFELIPEIDEATLIEYQQVFKILLVYSAFAFHLNLIREWIKDCQDVNGDRAGGRHTLPLAVGVNRNMKLVAVMTAIALVTLVYVVNTYFYRHQLLLLYGVFTLIGPLMYVTLKAWNASSKSELKQLSLIIKVIMINGISSFFFIHNLFY
ncbi:MAG: geranylgeranylglycerol-phosphate geranylgeranyltransferase [Nonlabens sp.]